MVLILGPVVQRPGKAIHCINHYPLDTYHQKPLARAFQRMAIFPGGPTAHPKKQLGATDKASQPVRSDAAWGDFRQRKG